MESQLQKFYSHPWRWSLTPARPLPHQQLSRQWRWWPKWSLTAVFMAALANSLPVIPSWLWQRKHLPGVCSWLSLLLPSHVRPGTKTVFLHTQSSPARARLKDFDEKMNFLVNFHFLWGVHMRTHQCGSGGRTGSVLFGSENTIMEYLLLTLL